MHGQTLQNPTFGNTTTNTLKVKTNVQDNSATKIPVQSDDGSINWVNKADLITQTTAGTFARVNFTGDVSVVNSVNYYATNTANKGTVASVAQTVTPDDNQKLYFAQDYISVLQPSLVIYPLGNYSGQFAVQVANNSVQQKFYIEVYKTDNLGAPIASGVSGASIGSLGVTLITTLESGLVSLTGSILTNITFAGTLTGQLTINPNERIRYHIAAEKVGTAGAGISMQIFSGTSYNSYYDVPVPVTTDGVVNKSIVSPANTTTDALNSLKADNDNSIHKTGNETKVGILTLTTGLDLGAIVANSTQGYITKATSPFIHNFYAAQNPLAVQTGNNLNIGVNSGNFNSDNNNYASVMVGFESGKSNKNGYSNVGLGYRTLTLNENGFGNTALGTYALGNTVNATQNTSVGWHSMLFKTSGDNNVAIGVDALTNNLTGSLNTALGSNAGAGSTGTGNVFLGYAAGFAETGSNKLYISNNSTVDPIIKGDFSTKILELGAGTTNKIKTDGSGVAIFTSFLTTANAEQNASFAAQSYGFNVGGVSKIFANSASVGIGVSSGLLNKFEVLVNTGTGSASTDGAAIHDGQAQRQALLSGVNTASGYSYLQSVKGGVGFRPLQLNPNGGDVIVGNNLSAGLYSGGATLTGTPTAPTATAGTNTTQIATTAFVLANARPNKIYRAILNQTGTSAPVATVLENTLGGTVVWTRNSPGNYSATLTGAFPAAKTFWNGNVKSGIMVASVTNINVFGVLSADFTGTAVDANLTNNSIEISVYP